MGDNKPVIMPFGKYKGKPIKVLMQDEQYANWLKDQPWFREKFSNHCTIIINSLSTEPVNTPEHNEMQVKSINADYRPKIAYAVSDMEHGVYIVVNDSMPGLIKIGMTLRSMSERLAELNNTSIPVRFQVAKFFICDEPPVIERKIHEHFKNSRLNDKREFFRETPDNIERFVGALGSISTGQKYADIQRANKAKYTKASAHYHRLREKADIQSYEKKLREERYRLFHRERNRYLKENTIGNIFNFKQKHRPEKYNPKNDFVEANDVPAWDELANRLEYIDKELEEIEKKRLAAKKIADDFFQRELAPLMQYRAK
jgi:hypothetical protein